MDNPLSETEARAPTLTNKRKLNGRFGLSDNQSRAFAVQ